MGLNENDLAEILKRNPNIKIRETTPQNNSRLIEKPIEKLPPMEPVVAFDAQPKMNKLESAYSYNLDLMKMAGQIKHYKFEPFNLRLASPKCFYRIDFLVINLENQIELHETKGPWVDGDSLVKFKVAAESFPFFLFKWVTREDDIWIVRELRDGKWIRH